MTANGDTSTLTWEQRRLLMISLFEEQLAVARVRLADLEKRAESNGIDLTPHRMLIEHIEARLARIKGRK